VSGLELVPGLGQVLAAWAGELVEIPGRLCTLRDKDPDDPAGVDGRVGLIGIAVAALAGSPLLVPGSVLVPKLATCGVLDPLLQAASARAAAATRTASAQDRRCILVISRRFSCTPGAAVSASQPS
jgi:hypothetical protein